MPVSIPVRQLSKYGLVGAVGTGVQYALMALLLWQMMDDAVLASTLGAVAGAFVNYLLNYFYTFRSDKGHVEALIKFWIVAIVGWSVNAGVLAFGISALGLPVIPAQLIATAMVFFLTFVLNRMWTFS